jgi:arylsulfatase
LTNLSIDKPELYDLRRDPGERYDVIAQYPEVVIKLSTIADEMRDDLGDNLTRRKGAGQRKHGLVSNFNK